LLRACSRRNPAHTSPYIVAIKLASTGACKAPELQSRLETYFRGLCQTVAKKKKVDVDVSKISAQVRADRPDAQPARSLLATVEGIDAFVSRKPLTLNLKMIVDARRSEHRIFAAVSPKPTDSPIWKPLRTLNDEFQERKVGGPEYPIQPISCPI
jgi:hypothetical protein